MSTPRGEALFRELVWVHDAIRRDLETVQALADQVLAELEPGALKAELEALETNGPLWRLKANCLYYCRFVHSHHRLEDIALFPSLRDANPALVPIVDQLEADHRKVSDYLDAVEAGADALTENDEPDARRRIASSLNELAEHLLGHLAFEEESVAPTIRRLTDDQIRRLWVPSPP